VSIKCPIIEGFNQAMCEKCEIMISISWLVIPPRALQTVLLYLALIGNGLCVNKHEKMELIRSAKY
jgi:hypothetical protein